MAIEFTDAYEKASIITHGGNFHADDIFCISAMEVLFDNIKLYRLKLEDEGTAKPLDHQIWFDIGGGTLDHHQKGGNGNHPSIIKDKKPIPYASFGLVWRKYGLDICKKYYMEYENESYYEELTNYAFDAIEYYIARGIDASDNGIFPIKPEVAYKDDKNIMDVRSITISCIISLFNLDDDDIPDGENEGLMRALEFARNTLFTFFNRIFDDFLQRIPLKNIKASVSEEYSDNVYNACVKFFNTEKNESIQLFDTEVFPNNKLFDYWSKNGEEYLKTKYSDDWEMAKKGIVGLINGFCADMEGINARAKGSYDDVYFSTFKDVFGEKMYYSGDNYEADLNGVINTMLNKFVKDTTLKVSSYKIVKNAVFTQKGRILVLQDKIYWRDAVYSMPEAQSFWFVITQTQSGLWKVCPIRSRKTRNGFRKGFPHAWLGLRREELESKRNIHGVYFIHDSGIMALCDDKKSAIRLCKKAYGNTENKN